MIEVTWAFIKLVVYTIILVAMVSGIVGFLVQVAINAFSFGAGI
jgi:hypothetical protein